MAYRIPGQMTAQEAERFRQNLSLLVAKSAAGGRRFTVGTIVGDVRTKQYPDNAIAGQPVRIIFVADVRLREFQGQPIARDVLVSNQAHQLVTGSAANNSPVTVEITKSGTMTVVGRAGFASDDRVTDYFTIDDVDGLNLDFAIGLRLREIDDLDPALLALVNEWRADNGLVAFVGGDVYAEDPQVDVHGENYYPGYLGLTDGGRFLDATVGVICSIVTTRRDWYDDDVDDPAGDWWYGTPNAFSSSLDPWYAQSREVVCQT